MAPSGSISIADFRAYYQHKMVSESFESVMANMDSNTDGFIQCAEFMEYYHNLSANFVDDSAFKEYIYASWGLN